MMKSASVSSLTFKMKNIFFYKAIELIREAFESQSPNFLCVNHGFQEGCTVLICRVEN